MVLFTTNELFHIQYQISPNSFFKDFPVKADMVLITDKGFIRADTAYLGLCFEHDAASTLLSYQYP